VSESRPVGLDAGGATHEPIRATIETAQGAPASSELLDRDGGSRPAGVSNA
jgi:hypothetical protein